MGLGDKFIDDVEQLFEYLEKNPKLFKQVSADVHQASLKRFPFVILYKIKDNTVVIVAVFNCYQNPVKKLKRTKD